MKKPLAFWLAAVPLWTIAALVGATAAYTFFDASEIAGKNRTVQAALLRRAAFVDSFREEHRRLPSEAEFTRGLDAIGDHLISWFQLYSGRPGKEEGFSFPAWTSDNNFAIGYWRGDWLDFYDSQSRSTSVGQAATAAFWRRDALVPFGWSLLFAAPPFFYLWVRRWITMRRQTPNQAMQRTAGAPRSSFR